MLLSPRWSQLPPLPDAEGFAGAFAGVSGGALLFAGGANFVGQRPWEGGIKRWYDTVYILASPSDRWQIAGQLPRPNAYGVGVTWADELICVGGGDRHENFREVFALRWDGRRLHRRSLPPLPVASAFNCGAVAEGMLFIAGGLDRPEAAAAVRYVWSLDLRDPHALWRVRPPMPGVGRLNAQAAAHGEKFYLVGGVALRPNGAERPHRTFLSDVYAYSPAGGWQQWADLPHPVAAAPTPLPVDQQGRLLVMSGDDGTRTALDGPDHPGFRRDGLLFDPALNAWTAVSSGPISRATVPTAFWHGEWVVPNGERRPGYRSNEVWSVRL